MLPQEFVTKWRTLVATPDFKEIAYYQQHLIDLCALVAHEPPATSHAHGRPFAFEQSAKKDDGGTGRADAWYKGYFAIEYKGPGADLDKAYSQLRGYSDELGNPPLLIVTDFIRIIIHPRFNNSVNKPLTITLDDLTSSESLFRIRSMFYDPSALQTERLAERVTTVAAQKFGRIAELQNAKKDNPHDVAHYLIRLLFCLFAEDIDLLPNRLFTDLVIMGVRELKASGTQQSKGFDTQIRRLFAAMAEGDHFGRDRIMYFNGGLFDSDSVLPLADESLRILAEITELDWSAIEPAIFGTLFTRSLDPEQRAKLGAQYTSKDDILLVVEPVLMAPLRKEWEEVKAKARALAAQRDAAPTTARRQKLGEELRALVMGFVAKIRAIRVLDPACGSGNFLYISMRLLMDLEQEVSQFCGEVGLQPFFPEVGPWQMYGIEVNEYAHELAQTTLWIGFLQWRHENGYGYSEPLLKPLDNIKLMDAILAYDAQGKPFEPEWPQADVIVGNPPFLGASRIWSELGERYKNDLFQLYNDRIPACDLVCYWFEKARAKLATAPALRVGLLATQAIRGGVNREVLKRIKLTGDIFWAESDRDWILDGAAVHVSMIAFDNGLEQTRTLNGVPVTSINSNLTAATDVTKAIRLPENAKICFIGTKKAGSFDIEPTCAAKLLNASNISGRQNSDVVLDWVNGEMLTSRGSRRKIIYFGEMPITEAALYKAPFEYVRDTVYKERERNNEERARLLWWQHRRPATEMWEAVRRQDRYIATPRVSKYRLFVWLEPTILPDDGVYVFARSDDYFFGMLHSAVHELWARATGTQLREAESGFRYTPNTTFQTYPFPWPPGKEPPDDPRVKAIAAAAKELVELRDAWLNQPGLSAANLAKRTLTNLYNERPGWLDAAHRKLDAAVFDAYGWPHDLTHEDILARLLALNLERARN